MNAGELRSLSLRAVSARCPVALVVETPEGPVEYAVTGARYEPVKRTETVDGKEHEIMVSERLVLLARAGEGGAT